MEKRPACGADGNEDGVDESPLHFDENNGISTFLADGANLPPSAAWMKTSGETNAEYCLNLIVEEESRTLSLMPYLLRMLMVQMQTMPVMINSIIVVMM